jgi:hypothetical protein
LAEPLNSVLLPLGFPESYLPSLTASPPLP